MRTVRGYRGDRKLIVKVVIPVLLAMVMAFGAWGTAIVPMATHAATSNPGNPSTHSTTRGQSLPSAASGPNGRDASAMDVSRDVSLGIATNENLRFRKDMTAVPQAFAYDPLSGRAWDQYNRVLTMDPAFLPKDSGVLSFASHASGRTEITSSSGSAPTSGGIDAGGPYGGASTFEGDSVTFTAIVSDPNLIFFRWDFNNDGKWDTGTKANPWVDTLSVTHQYLDDFYDVVVLEAWDGFSSTSIRYTGWTLGSPSPFYYVYWFYDWTFGYKFKAKQTMSVNQLGFYRYTSDMLYGDKATIWDGTTQAKLAECSPSAGAGWQRCSLSSAITLTAGKDYVVSMRLGSSTFNIYYTRDIDKPANTDQVAFGGSVYSLFTPSPVFPTSDYSDTIIPLIEFYYDYTLSYPLTVRDTAAVEVNNVAPIVFDLKTDPAVVNEGQKTKFNAMFSDPGLDDQWTFQWCYGDGTCDPWSGIKVGSGLSQLANILVYSDVAPHYATQALDFYGKSYTFTSSIFALPALITSQQWDLIIYQSYFIAFIAPIIEDAMMTQLAGGAMVMYNNWYAFSRQAHPLLAYFGGQWVGDLFSPLTLFSWDPTSTLYSDPLTPPTQMDPTHNQFFRDGQKIKVLSNAFAPTGYTSNPQDSEAAMVVRNDKTTIWNGFTPQNFQGDQDFDGDPDMLELMVNEIRFVTGPEIPRSMPWPVPAAIHAYRDDDPTTGTPSDPFTPTLTVKDDDDGKLRGGHYDAITGFDSGNPWPAGWAQTRGFAWIRGYSGQLNTNAALYWFFYDCPYGPPCPESMHTLRSQTYDLSGMDPTASLQRVTLSYTHSWEANFDDSYQDGTVEVSTDGFATSFLIAEYHHNNPSSFQGTESFDISSIATGKSNVQVRFNVIGYDDWWWHIGSVEMFAEWGTLIIGTGSGSSSVTVNNVAPKAFGGPQRGLAGEATPFNFANYKIDDPTLYNPYTGKWDPVSTEWFAYRWIFDDGTQSAWNYLGTLQLPKLKVLVLHTLSFGSGDAFLAEVRNVDLVGQMDNVDFLFLSPAQIPTLDQMLGYDIIVFATNYATFSSTFELTRREIGNRLANYLDIKGATGGVVTLMATYDNSPFYGDLFTLLGRYSDQDYGAFEKTTYGFSPGSLGEILQPTHPVMQGVTKLTSPFIHSGNYALTTGAQLLARWDDGNSAIGVKELANGARSVNSGGFSGQGSAICGGDCPKWLRNSFMWSSHTVVPTNDIAPQIHTYGDNGIYNVDLQLIDDDMGWSWDAAANAPTAIAGLEPTISHTYVPVEIYNEDPTIATPSVQAYLASNVCLRVAGKEWGTVVLKFFVDGVQSASVQVTRTPGSPNSQAKCTLARLDVLAKHTFSSTVQFTPLSGKTSGSNPFWVIVDPWRKTNPGHGTTVFSGNFKVQNPAGWVKTMALNNLVRHLIDSGRGAPVEFAATASDPGTDDLAFVWMWEDGTKQTIQIHKNADGSVAQGTLSDPQHLGFGEPFFDRSANTIRSPAGTMHFTVRDTAVHVIRADSDRDGDDDCGDGDRGSCGDGHHEGRYEDDDNHDGDWRHANDNDCGEGEHGNHEGDHEHDDDDCSDSAPMVLWVALTVLDDDNTRGYPSLYFHDGTDMEFLVVYLA